MNKFDVSVYAIRRRAGRRRPFEVRWRAAGRSRSKSFITRKLADSYRAELVRAARTGLEFDPLTGEPAAWNLPEPAIVTWYQEATAYAMMKWPSLAAHSRASLAESLATVTPVLTRPGARNRPDQRELRTVLYRHAFNPARPADPGSPAAQILDWAQQASLPVGCLSDPAVLRTALEALTLRLDGSRAAANTIIRKLVVLHDAVEGGLLPDNPLDIIAWQIPRSSAALDPVVVASPAQVSRLLDAVTQVKPEMTAFFGCLYYAALRPEEAVALRYADCHLPGSGWGTLRLAAAAPRTAAAWTSSGTSHEQRGLKLRGTIDVITLQTLARRGDIPELTAGYGLIVADECHHIPAAAFEDAARQITARRWLGLTATPYRRDKLDDLIGMQVGPVRHAITVPRQATGTANMLPGSAPGGHPTPVLHVHPTVYRYTGGASPSTPGGMALIYKDLIASDERNQQVTADVAAAVSRGRNCLVLTNWTGHLETIAGALRALGHDPVILKGGMGAKDRAAALARLTPQPGGPALLAVATGPYAGEGFDCPPLDTLFLAAPVASKGSILQYAGRILRPYDGKATAEVHDYHDEQVGVLASSLAKRAPGYTSVGFPDPRKLPYSPSAAAVPPVVQASRG